MKSREGEGGRKGDRVDGNQSKEHTGESEENLWVLIRCDRCEMHYNPSGVHCQLWQLDNNHLKAAEDVTVLLVSAPLHS